VLLKRSLLFVLSTFLFFAAHAQDSLLQWKFSVNKQNDSIYTIHGTAQVAPGWHLYGKNAAEELEGLTYALDYENAAPAGATAFTTNAQQISDPVFENRKVSVYTGEVGFTQEVKIRGQVPASLKGTITAYIGKGTEFLTSEHKLDIPLSAGGSSTPGAGLKFPAVDLEHPAADCGGTQAIQSDSILVIFFFGFIGGIIALITPCVFPLIPVTVSFFTKRSKTRKQALRNGLLYGFFIFLIYTLISTPFHIAGNVNKDVFNNISTNAWLNLFFFLIFIVFAISFFGFFEITLPSGIATKADAKSGISSTSGIFFMALTLVIVSFSCTGVILSSLLVGVASNGAWPLTAGLAGFGAALALPFALFAIFPHWLQSLPKSGGWLDTVKKILAFAELALALKFLSSADLVMHWGLLSRGLFIILWIIIGIAMILYLFGILRLPHDYKGQHISKGRKITGVIALAFTIYLSLGLAGITDLRYLSGILPPPKEQTAIVNDYDKAVALAKKLNKPVMIDFTGWACTNCRRMEENVWSRPEVKNYMKDNFVLVSLYVDDRAKLPVNERITYTNNDGTKKDLNTVGDKWITFEQESFKQVAQPLYVIISPDGKLLSRPKAYTPDPQEYLQWLQCSRNAMK
jgi:thiol:disulfide interchange protein